MFSRYVESNSDALAEQIGPNGHNFSTSSDFHKNCLFKQKQVAERVRLDSSKTVLTTCQRNCLWQEAKNFFSVAQKNAYHLFQLQKDNPKTHKVFDFQKQTNVMKLSSWKKSCHLPKVILKKMKGGNHPYGSRVSCYFDFGICGLFFFLLLSKRFLSYDF